MIEKDTTNYNLRNAREQWLDKLRYKKIKLAKCEEKRRRKQDNIMFQRDQKGFFRMLEEEEAQRERGNARNGKVRRFLGRYLGNRRKNAKYSIDGRDKERTK